MLSLMVPPALEQECHHGCTGADSTKVTAKAGWTIDEGVRLRAMLRDLPDLLPEKRTKLAMADNTGQKSKETGKAAQERVMAMMRQKQRNFAASIDQSEATKLKLRWMKSALFADVMMRMVRTMVRWATYWTRTEISGCSNASCF
jgi:hypothetical protein